MSGSGRELLIILVVSRISINNVDGEVAILLWRISLTEVSRLLYRV